MFAELTWIENTELYLTIERGYRKLDKFAGSLIDLRAYEACETINEMSGELIRLLEDLNETHKASIPGLAEHTAAAQQKIIEASR